MTEWADTVVACVGYSPLMEGEQGECIGAPDGGDKSSIALPEHQLAFLRRLRAKLDVNPQKPRLVVVITCGSPLELAEVHALADAVLVAWYPGEQGGMAVGDVLWGNSDASGRLPATFPQSLADLPPFEDYAMTGRTYRFMEKPALYPFGFGLGYSEFEFSDLTVNSADAKIEAVVTVQNTGARDGETVLQIYARWPGLETAPRCSLVAVSRVALSAGQSRHVALRIDLDRLIPYAEDGGRIAGPHQIELIADHHAPVQAVVTTSRTPLRHQFVVSAPLTRSVAE
jgi:beta-glucosidase